VTVARFMKASHIRRGACELRPHKPKLHLLLFGMYLDTDTGRLSGFSRTSYQRAELERPCMALLGFSSVGDSRRFAGQLLPGDLRSDCRMALH
jgi:hypothetical protein